MKHFRREEFACKCCGENWVHNDLLSMLDNAREKAGIPFVVSSGCRCAKHNRKVGGKIGSSHLFGLAADIACVSSMSRWIILKALFEAGFARIGIDEEFIHVDIDDSKPQAVAWTYE